MDELTYTAALAELEKILAQLRSDTCDVDSLVERTRRAAFLLDFCSKKLTATEDELQQVLQSLTTPQA